MKPIHSSMLKYSSLYMMLIGLGIVFFPNAMEAGYADTMPPFVLYEIRGYGGLLISVSLLVWLLRNTEQSQVLRAMYISSAFGYTFAAAIAIAQENILHVGLGWLFAVLHFLFAGWFLFALQKVK